MKATAGRAAGTTVVLVLLLMASTATLQAGESSTTLKMFSTQAQVKVDASGSVVSVLPDPRLPSALAASIGSTVAGWRFTAPEQEGRPVGGVTFVHLAVCGPGRDDDAPLAFEYVGHGAGRIGGPTLPDSSLAMARVGAWASVVVTYVVHVDGAASVEGIERTAGGAPLAVLRAPIGKWMRASRFAPEIVGGVPVSTRTSLAIDFDPPGESPPRSCEAAFERLRPADGGSWFKRLPSG